MCPLCILAAISLGGGTALAGGIHWMKGKFTRSEEASEGCQCLHLIVCEVREKPAGSALDSLQQHE
jgi:hypothetical protein